MVTQNNEAVSNNMSLNLNNRNSANNADNDTQSTILKNNYVERKFAISIRF